MLCCAVLCCAVLCCAACHSVLCCVPCSAVYLAVLHSSEEMFVYQCRQRITVIPHLISHCNSCLQALLPAQTSSLPSHLVLSSGQLAKPLAPHDSPSDSPDAQAASDKAAASKTDLASVGMPAEVCTGSGHLEAPGAVAEVPVKVNGPLIEEAVLDGALLEGPVLEGPVGQALAEAAIEMVLAALKNSGQNEDPGQHSVTKLLRSVSRLHGTIYI